VARWLAPTPVSPNALTVFACLLMLLTAGVIASGQARLGGGLIILFGPLDALDGRLARLRGHPTRFGAFLDSTLDRVADSALLVALVPLLEPMPSAQGYLLLAALVLSWLVPYTRARAEGLGLVCRDGVLPREVRLAVLAVGLLLEQIVPALAIIVILSAVTVLQRGWLVWRETRE